MHPLKHSFNEKYMQNSNASLFFQFGLEFWLRRHERVHQWVDSQPFNEVSGLVAVIHANDTEPPDDLSNNLVGLEFPLPEKYMDGKRSNSPEAICIVSSSEEAKADAASNCGNRTYIIATSQPANRLKAKHHEVGGNFQRFSWDKRNSNDRPIKCGPSHNDKSHRDRENAAENDAENQVPPEQRQIQPKNRRALNSKEDLPNQKEYLNLGTNELKQKKSTHFDCDVCRKRLPSESSLRQHVLVHNNRWCIKCALCGEQFIQNENKIRHKCRDVRK